MRLVILFVLLAAALATKGQTIPEHARLVGGPCEGCEAVFEYGTRELAPVDTLPDFRDAGPKMRVSGTVYQPDGITPAEGVILYLYHTDQRGIYPKIGDETGWARQHGYLRGWVKTGPDGTYAFYTLKPGIYPNRDAPAHIHATILEPGGKYYWIAEYHFDDDPLLTERETNPASPRGGTSGILALRREGDLWIGLRDIITGRNVPGYK